MIKSKSKKIFSAILSLVVMASLAVSCFSVNAAVPKYLIDNTKTANLTLFKYEVPDMDKITHGGTGEKSDSEYVPKEAKPLGGVTFTAKKIDEITNYFNEDGKELPTPAQASEMKSIKTFKAVTDKNGIAELKNLPLGIYYIEETDGPAQITKKIEPIVISLPLTNKDGSEWIYDVYSYPKNQTGYGDASIKKIDAKTGAPLANAEFTLESYGKDNKALVNTIGTKIKTGSSGIATITSLPSNTYYHFTETAAPDDSYILDDSVTYEFFVDATGDMIYGWDSIDSNNQPVGGKIAENNTLVVLNEKPEIHKFILDKPKGTEGIDHTANYGDTVNWKIRSTIPTESLTKKISTYNVVDMMSKGLKYKDSEVYLDNAKKLTEGTDYTVASEGLNVTFAFKPTSIAGYGEVEIYFNTILTKDAPLVTDIPNTSKLVYSNKVSDNSSLHELPSEVPTVHTGGYQFVKTDGKKELAGAKFAIYATEDDAQNSKNAIMTATSNDKGIVSFTGLAYGDFSVDEATKKTNGVVGGSRDYWIAEIEAPDGFSLLSSPFKVTINNKSHLAENNDKVVNNPVPELPKTGGHGVLPIALIAGGMITSGIAVLLSKRKRNSK